MRSRLAFLIAPGVALMLLAVGGAAPSGTAQASAHVVSEVTVDQNYACGPSPLNPGVPPCKQTFKTPSASITADLLDESAHSGIRVSAKHGNETVELTLRPNATETIPRCVCGEIPLVDALPTPKSYISQVLKENGRSIAKPFGILIDPSCVIRTIHGHKVLLVFTARIIEGVDVQHPDASIFILYQNPHSA